MVRLTMAAHTVDVAVVYMIEHPLESLLSAPW